MTRKKSIFSCNEGASIVLVGLSLMLLLLVTGVAVDIGRIYAVQEKAQSAADAALLGAVATLSTNVPDYQTEVRSLFDANYPASYMGSTIQNFTAVSSPDNTVFDVSFDVVLPMAIMQLFGDTDNTIRIAAQVTKPPSELPRTEVALVVDNTGSMAGSKIAGLKTAAHKMMEILFAGKPSLPNLHVSFVPYDVAVNIGTARRDWIQPDFQAGYDAMVAGVPSGGWVANRKNDYTPNAFVDVSDEPPTTATGLFRIPTSNPVRGCPADLPVKNLAPMKFGMNVKSDIDDAIDAMVISGCTRINVGLMWGWFTLSPKWQGVWDGSIRPEPAGPGVDKFMVLMTDGENTVYATDDATVSALCSAIKGQGIKLYTIGFGAAGQFDAVVLSNCASPNSYFHAPTSAQLETVFKAISDDILIRAMRLSK